MDHANAVQGIVQPMTHGDDIHCTIHDPWKTNFPWVMGRTEGVEGWIPMDHGSYSGTSTPWVMSCTEGVGGFLPMDHGLYGSTSTPWVMGCTVVHLPHG